MILERREKRRAQLTFYIPPTRELKARLVNAVCQRRNSLSNLHVCAAGPFRHGFATHRTRTSLPAHNYIVGSSNLSMYNFSPSV
jgi:hypothetical protein